MLTVATYLLLLFVAVMSCSRYNLGEEEEPEPPEPEYDKLIWYVASYGDDLNEGRDVGDALATVQETLSRILIFADEEPLGWPEHTEAEIVILDDVSLSGEPAAATIAGGLPYPRIRLRGPSMEVEEMFGPGTLRPDDSEHYVLYVENNTEEVLLGDNLIITEGKGGVYVAEAKLTIESGATITGNFAADGSGVYVGINGVVTMKDGGVISNNVASSLGGGVYVASQGTFKMDGGTIRENMALFGGGVAVGAGGTMDSHFIMKGDASITGNEADLAGGGVYVGAGKNVKFEKVDGGNIGENIAETNHGIAVALGSTDVNSPNQIARFRDEPSRTINKLYAEYVFTGEPATTLWFFNGTDVNWNN